LSIDMVELGKWKKGMDKEDGWFQRAGDMKNI
jgi:hypothetical protein